MPEIRRRKREEEGKRKEGFIVRLAVERLRKWNGRRLTRVQWDDFLRDGTDPGNSLRLFYLTYICTSVSPAAHRVGIDDVDIPLQVEQGRGNVLASVCKFVSFSHHDTT